MRALVIIAILILMMMGIILLYDPPKENEPVPGSNLIRGVVEKVEWLECGRGNMMVIKFEDGRYIKLQQWRS